jgi:hypothetical protein
MEENRQSEFILHVNKMIEFAHDFFVRDDSDTRGRDVMAKTVKKAPARAKAKKPAARKPVRKTTARKAAARKPAARKAAKPAAKKRKAA